MKIEGLGVSKNSVIKILAALRTEEHKADFWKNVAKMHHEMVKEAMNVLNDNGLEPSPVFFLLMKKVTDEMDNFDPAAFMEGAEKEITENMQ